MRKVLIGVVMFLASVLGFIGLASCTDEQPPAHEHSLKYRYNEVFHSQICTVCYEKFIWRPHQWGDWVETKAPTQDEKGSHYRVCSVCSYKEKKYIDRLPIAAGETTAEWTAVYVQVPASWGNVNIFYFNSKNSNNISYDYMMPRSGKAMTLVDETKHIYGFQIPKGVDRIEFRGSERIYLVTNLKWSPERNLFVIQQYNVELPPAVAYKNYTPKDTDPELAKPTKNPPITYVTMYVKLPEAWDACNIFFSGVQFAESDAHGVPMTKVKGQENVWMYDKVVEGSTRVGVNNNSFGDISNITAAISNVPKEANAFIIIKNGDRDYDAVPAIYENGVFTKIGIQELWVRGTMNEWNTNDTYKMTIKDNEATIELDLESGDQFKISDEKGSDWATFGYVDTLGSAFLDNRGNIYVLDTGTYIITISNLDDINPILSITAKS